MLSPDEFESKYPVDDLAGELPDRPISSLRDLQHLYGRLYTLATAGGGEYAAYLTPNESDDLLGEPESLVALRVDLTGERPALADDPIFVTALDEDLVTDVAHCDYDSARGIDHSITHRTGRDKDPAAIAGYLHDRLVRWAKKDDVVRRIADNHEDGWIIDALADLGDREGIKNQIEGTVTRAIEGPTTALTTVLVKLPGDDEYRFPGELDTKEVGEHRTDVFQRAMRARKLSKLVSKNEASDSAGQAVDLVTGNAERAVGTAEDPLNYFLGKQTERFPNFDVDEAWRSHPISEDSAITLMNASTFVEDCAYSTLGAQVHYLPYFFGTVEPSDAHELYSLLYEVHGNDDLTPVEHAYRTLAGERGDDIPLDLRFYVSAVRRQQAKRYDVLGDTMNGSLLHPVEVANRHTQILNSWVFDDQSNVSSPLPTHENWLLLSGGKLLRAIVSGGYYEQTFTRPDDDQDVAADDYRIRALVNTLSGESIAVERMLEEFVDRLLDDDYDSFPSFRVASQFAQLRTLASAGLLDASDDRYSALTEPATYDNHQMTSREPLRADGGTSAAVARADKLESFIEETPSLEDNERRSAFLMGALVGQVSNYQSGVENRSTTLIDQYPIKGVTVPKVKRLAEEAISKNIVYSRENGMSGTMYAEIVDALRDALAVEDPDEWEIDTTDLRFYYSLGVTYGLNSYASNDGDGDSSGPTEN